MRAFHPSMNRILVIISFLLLGISHAQQGNDWINYSQNYYSFKIYEDGVYKIDYATMSAAGLPLSSLSPDDFQVFGFMEEQDIYVEDGGDGTFDPGDYIVFEAHKNNTWLDSLMYDDPDDVLNKYYPLYNDTINYYLTWNTAGANERMAESADISFASYTPQPYIRKTVFVEEHASYLQGYIQNGMSNATYVDGEGWSSNRISATGTTNYKDHNLNTPNIYTGAGAEPAKVVANVCGASNASYVIGAGGNHHVEVQYGTSLITAVDTIYSAYEHKKLEFEIPVSDLAGSVTRIRYQLVADLPVASDFQSVPYTEITYSRNLNLLSTSYFEGTVAYNSSESKTRFDFTNFTSTAPWCLIRDAEGNVMKCPVINSAGTFQVIVPNAVSGTSQNLKIFDESEIQSVSTLSPINGTGSFTDYSSYNFEEAYIIISHKNIWTSATEYATYRQSVAGGSHNVVLLDIDELYHQFGGGVEKHVMGIRYLVKFAYETATLKPKYLFLLGKGVRESTESIPTGGGTRVGGLAYNMCLIPTFGYPANDVLITNNLSGNEWDPLLPTGRLAASTNTEVLLYLDKVIEFETEQDPSSIYSVDDKLWQKQVLHFGGGANATEQSQFKNYLENYESMIEGPDFGGNVTAFYKTVSDPIDPVTLYEVNDYINSGVSIMTFFGHASADGFDQNVDDPANWENEGKYPLVIGNACLTGNIFEPNNLSTSEEFVMIEDKGAIAFLANVKQAYSSSLNVYSENLMREITQNSYGESIGVQIQRNIDALQSPMMSFGNFNVMMQMTLHGDPALKINPHERPELEINESSFFITPDVVDLTVDSIDVNVVLYNLGKSATDTFGIEVRRFFPNGGGDSLYTKQIFGIDYIDTIVFTIPFYANDAIGINEFEVRVDQPSFVDEQYDEVGNNMLSRQVIFDVDGIYPVYPYEYAIVPNDTITLKGSTVNPFAEIATYRFEIDTTDTFDSPEHRFALVTSLGGVIEVDFNDWILSGSGTPSELILEDSVAYFWRTALVGDDSTYYIESSFQHINGRTGWGQDHFYQFKNNQHSFLDYNRIARKRLFGDSFKTINCDVYGNANTWLEFAFTLIQIDGELAEYNFCGTNPQLFVAVIDPFTLEPWGTYYDDGTTIHNPTHDFGNQNNNGACRPRVEYHFGFAQNSPTQMASFQNMVENEIPDSHYVLIYTSRYANYSEWDAVYPDAYTVFANLGSDSIAPGKPDVPFIGFYKQGNPDSYHEVYANDINDFIRLEDTLWGFDFFGNERSTVIGPAQSWDKLYWKQDPLDASGQDSTILRVYGRTYSGAETLVMSQPFTANDSIINLGSYIDVNTYPMIRLESELWDTIGFSPAQVDRWHVLYTPVPEAALDGSAGVFWLPSDTLYEGQEIAVAFDVRNISNLPMDSLLINYWIEDAEHNLIPISYPRQDSLRVGETIKDTITLPTVSYGGYNSLWVEVNPYISSSIKDQPEQYHFNNIGQIPFYTIVDEENPILDVTFNGQHLLNGDIIDPQSQLVITLKDENPYLIMDAITDTANFGIYLTDPNGTQRRLNFLNNLGEEEMQWIPANPGNLKFQIIKDFNLIQDGTYRLLVQGVDRSGNLSGDLDYEIEFEIDQTPSVTHLMNYPNPFSTSTQFVFTLTGTQIPDEFTIQILTISGKIVREITVDELGPIQIGRNITTFAWDGTDEYGDILANGVYLYRVITKINGESLEHRESGADQYFTKEFGKMYIIR